MPDRLLSCRDCGAQFAFREAEQKTFKEKGYRNVPSRCPDCREKRNPSQPVGDWRSQLLWLRDSKELARPKRVDSVATSTAVTCSSCGKETRVPFVPTTGRPVYCSDCFATTRATSAAKG